MVILVGDPDTERTKWIGINFLNIKKVNYFGKLQKEKLK
jgi:hypothetical protein